jgi:uncharacterized membrane protein HdeD (DUF308 family)
MNLANPALSQAERTIAETIQTSWALFLVQGLVMIALGLFAIIWPQISTLATDLFVGWVFLLSGLTGLITMFFAPSVASFLWSFVTAALTLLVGVLLLWHPIAGAVSLTLVLVAFFIVEGLFQIAGAIRHREALPGSWGWLLMSGVADLVLAALIILGWPATAIWALGLMVGVNLLTSGLAIAMVAVAAHNAVRIVGQATR